MQNAPHCQHRHYYFHHRAQFSQNNAYFQRDKRLLHRDRLHEYQTEYRHTAVRYE